MNRRQIIRRNVTLLVAVTLLAALAMVGWTALAAQHAGSAEPVLEAAVDLCAEGGISGTVYAPDGVTPVSGVDIEFEHLESNTTFTGRMSRQDGSYHDDEMPAGAYIVKVRGTDDYAGEYYQDSFTREGATTVTVEGGQTTTGIDFVLNPGASIYGKVLADDGVTPLAFQFVSVTPTDYSIMSGHIWEGGISHPDGTYRVVGLVPGEHIVECWGDSEWMGEYYLNAVSEEDAMPVDLVAQTPVEINFCLEQAGSISGRVLGGDGSTPQVGIVVWTNRSPGSPALNTTSMTDADGCYSLTGLRAGAHTVWIGDTLVDRIERRDVVVVGGQETTGVDLYAGLDYPASVTGMVQLSDGTTPLEGIEVQLVAMTEDACAYVTYSHADGSYQFADVRPGQSYYAYVHVAGYAHQYYSNATVPGSATEIFAEAGSVVSNVNFTLDSQGRWVLLPIVLD